MVMPKLVYPVVFENGLVGVSCNEDIENREMFLAVPYKMMFCLANVQKHPIVGPLIKKHDECFRDEGRNDSEMQMLVFGLLYELTLGVKSYWYPYLRLIFDIKIDNVWN